MVHGAPVQTLLPANVKPIRYKETVLNPLADYKIQARVLSTKTYWFGEDSNIIPIDIAVGWDEMSDSAVLDQLRISQAGRFLKSY